nr:hypothetical protein [Deltaproteobacteria bacterium]
VLPEGETHRAQRVNALLIALEAYKHQFARVVDPRRATQADLEPLRAGLELCVGYVTEFQRVYGATSPVSVAIVESRAELEAMLTGAGVTAQAPPPSIDFQPMGPSLQLERPVLRRGPSGTALIVAGGTTAAVGLSMTSLIIVGAIRRRAARRDLDAAREQMDDGAARDAERDRRSANAMLVSGSVLTGVLSAAGFTMLGIGINRRVRYMAFAPELRRGYAGLSLTGRF